MNRRMRRGLVLVLVLLLGGVTAALAANPSPPTVSTGSASSVATSSATVAGTINPNSADSTWQFVYGTSTDYGLTTPVQTIPADTTASTVTAPLTKLTGGTTYHYKLVATNAAGNTSGGDKSFKTVTPPAKPGGSTSAASSVTTTGAKLNGSVDPNGQSTEYVFEYGTTTGYGFQTPVGQAGSGTSAKTVSMTVAGLTPNIVYHYRIVVTSAGGQVIGSDRTFTTGKLPLALAIGAMPDPVVYGQTVTIRGQLTGSVVARQAVSLQSNPFPYTRGFKNVGSQVLSDARGAVKLVVAPFSASTQFRLVSGSAASATVTVEVRPSISLRVRRIKGRKISVSGTLHPTSVTGVVSIQRRTATGRFVPVKRVALSGGHYVAHFGYKRGRVFRAVLRPGDNGPVLAATSKVRRTPS